MAELKALQQKILDFRNARDWAQLHGFQIGNINIKDLTLDGSKKKDLNPVVSELNEN
jgi:hypothetical protein